MSVSVSSTSLENTSETPLEKETQLFQELFARLINAILNRIFDLRPEKAARRMWSLILLLIVALFVVSLRFYPFDLWTKYARDIFLYYLTPGYASIYVGNPLINIANYIYHVFTDPRIFQYFPIFLAPFFIALQAAALYLADIFELENVSIARGFIWSVTLSGSEETIRVSQGGISEQDRHSPTYLIGGPGKVIVDLEGSSERPSSDRVAVVRVEQLAPFQNSALRNVIAGYPNLQEIVWVQEEPRNMGAWSYMEPRLRELIGGELPVRYIGRPERSSPAEGSLATHNEEQARIVAAAYADAPELPENNGRRKPAASATASVSMTEKAKRR